MWLLYFDLLLVGLADWHLMLDLSLMASARVHFLGFRNLALVATGAVHLQI